MMYFEYPYAREDVFEQEMDLAEPSPWLSLGRTIDYGLNETTIPVLGDTFVHYLSKAFEDPIAEEDWESSPYYDPELEWNESMTATQAIMSKKALERDREFADWMRNVSMFSWHSIGGFAFTGLTDPLVLAPFTGVAG